MKFLWSIFFLFPIVATAQDCKLLRETDPFTKETKISTGFIFVQGGSFTIDADKSQVTVLFTIDGNGKCFDNYSLAKVKFENIKTPASQKNGGTMNCEGLFQFVFKNRAYTTTMLRRLMTQKIESIVFIGNNKKETTLTVKPETGVLIMKLATCLVDESKKLL